MCWWGKNNPGVLLLTDYVKISYVIFECSIQFHSVFWVMWIHFFEISLTSYPKVLLYPLRLLWAPIRWGMWKCLIVVDKQINQLKRYHWKDAEVEKMQRGSAAKPRRINTFLTRGALRQLKSWGLKRHGEKRTEFISSLEYATRPKGLNFKGLKALLFKITRTLGLGEEQENRTGKALGRVARN